MKIVNTILVLLLICGGNFAHSEDQITECGWTVNGTWGCISYNNFPKSVEGNEKWCGVTPMLFQVEYNPNTTVAHCVYHKKRDCVAWFNDAFPFGKIAGATILGCHKNPEYDNDEDE